MPIFENSSPKNQVSNQVSRQPLSGQPPEANGLGLQLQVSHEMEEVAQRYSRSSSSFLAAVLGGALGSVIGFVIGKLLGGPVIVTAPGVVIGAAAGVLAFRGRNHWRLEKATQKTKSALDLVCAAINSLPPDAPQEVRDQLYRKYIELMNEYARVARGSIDDKR